MVEWSASWPPGSIGRGLRGDKSRFYATVDAGEEIEFHVTCLGRTRALREWRLRHRLRWSRPAEVPARMGVGPVPSPMLMVCRQW